MPFCVLTSAQQNRDTCVCGGRRAEHSADTLQMALPQFPIFQGIPAVQNPISVPGPSRLIVDSAPITHTFSPQQLGTTTNERQSISISRAVVRNQGGIPSPASTPARRAQGRHSSHGQGATRSPRSKPPMKLTVLFIPLYVSNIALQGNPA